LNEKQVLNQMEKQDVRWQRIQFQSIKKSKRKFCTFF
jgi:hypothetical protein